MRRKLRRWQDLFRRRTLDTQFDAELSFHIEQFVEELTRDGLPAGEARRRAMLEFGGRERMKEELRDVHRMRVVDSTVANLKSAHRFIRKSPAFAAALVLTLALGIGANSAIMSAIDAVLLRPLPFPEPDRLVSIHEHNQDGKGPEVFVAPIRLEDWNRLNSTFEAMSGYYIDDGTESSGELPEKLTIAFTAPRFFQVWGIAPLAGRTFTQDELRAGGPNALVIGERYARRRFGSAANALNEALRLGAGHAIVVGVMPESFGVPTRDVDVWAPVPVDVPMVQNRDLTWYRVTGRLKPGVTAQQARADLATVQAQLGKQFPKTDAATTLDVQAVKEETVGGIRRSLWMLFGAVTLLLLIACTNVSALLLARTADREQEIATRFALGASRATIVAQLLTETLVLAVAGGIAGIAVVWAAGKSFAALAAALPRVREIGIDWRVLAYTLICSLAATMACGLLPALRFTRRSLSAGIAPGGRGQVSGGTTVQWTLVGVQIALAVVLLAGAGLLLRTFQQLGRVNPGFDAAHILTFHVSGSYAETVNYPALRNRIDRTLDALRATPGIQAAATALLLPGIGGLPRAELKVEENRDTDRQLSADVRFVSAGYFDTMRIPLLAGESCRESDTDTVIVNDSFAKNYLGRKSPLGYHLRVEGRGLLLPPSRIVGVAADARELGIDKAPAPTAYWCANAPTPSPYYLVRTHGDPAAMAEVVRHRIHEIEPARSVFDITPLESHLYESFGERRIRAVLLSAFALTAVLLSCIGVYGTLTYVVAVRRKEVGLRIALGARRGEIVRRFLVRGLTVSLAGCAAGLCLAAVLTRVLEGMLYGVVATDPQTFAYVLASVVGVSAVASLWPAIRAARVDPMRVLHEQ